MAQELDEAKLIKNHHRMLRATLRENGDVAAVWKDHLQDQDALRGYASAMHSLATKHWHGDNNCLSRVNWCHRMALDYLRDGGYEKIQDKEARRSLFLQNPDQYRVEIRDATTGSHSSALRSDDRGGKSRKKAKIDYIVQDEHSLRTEETQQLKDDSSLARERVSNIDTTSPSCNPFSPPYTVLDVGSCFNPFASFAEFEVLGIDLSPATETVFKCDFLSVPVAPNRFPPFSDVSAAPLDQPSSSSSLPSHLSLERPYSISPDAPREISALSAHAYDVIVFSLMLSYIPSPSLRHQACVKAWELLRQDGLLLIVEPDSSSEHKGMERMKTWKQRIEAIGFKRIRYEKLRHLQCLAFRSVKMNKDTKEEICELNIPQDFREEKAEH